MRILLFFLSGVYWLITAIKNWMYDLGILRTVKFNLISIVVGNLSTGGTGKTPMVIFLTNLLKKKVWFLY